MPRMLLAGGVRVRQSSAPGTSRNTHLVTCLRTGAAALIDPVPETRDVVADWLADPEIKLRYALYTSLQREEERPHRRLKGLQSRLGLTPRQSEPEAPPVWLDAVHASVAPVQGDGSHTVFVRIGTSVLALPLEPAGGQRRFTLVSTPPEVAMMRVGSLRIALGAFHVDVLPVAGFPDRVAYHAADRLFFPGGLRAGASRPPEDGLQGALAALPPETVVYASRSASGVTVSTVGAEAALARRRRCHVTTLDDDALDELAGLRIG